VNLELKKESKHFIIYFHPQDDEEALFMFVSAEKAYLSVARVYGGEAKFKIKMFMTYDREEVMKIGYNPPEGSSGGGPISTTELLWFNPIRTRKLLFELSKLGYA